MWAILAKVHNLQIPYCRLMNAKEIAICYNSTKDKSYKNHLSIY